MLLSAGLLAETRLLLDAMTVKPTSTRARQINRLIAALKACGCWTRLDVLYMLAAHDSQAALLNWKSPGTFTLQANNSPTFTADRGYAGDGVSMNLTNAYNPSTFGGAYTLNDAMLGVYVHSALTLVSAIDMQIGNARLQTNAAVTAYGCRVNDVSALANGGPVAVGHWVGRRSVSTGREIWKNGALVFGPDAVASTALAGTLTLLAGTAAANPSNARLSFAYAGGAVDAGGMSTKHSALMQYMQAVGAA